MMWLVEVALRRPISVAVMSLLMLVLGVLSFALMNVDIFPAINMNGVGGRSFAPSRKGRHRTAQTRWKLSRMCPWHPSLSIKLHESAQYP